MRCDAAIGTLMCWNRGEGAAAMAWHAAARSARTLLLDELGGFCRLALRPPGGLRMVSVLPPDMSLLRHDGDPARLTEALARILGGARGLRVLTVDGVDAPPLLAAAIAAFRPDVLAGTVPLPNTPMAGFAVPELDSTIHCDPPLRPLVEGWLRPIPDPEGRACRYAADEILCFGAVAGDAQAAVGVVRLMPGQRATLLFPGCGAGPTDLTLSFGRAVPPDALWVTVDGRDAAARWRDHCARARVGGRARHVVGVVHRAATDLDLVAVTVAPACDRW